MRLSSWIAREGLTYAAAARLGLANAGLVRKYAEGFSIPRHANLEKIVAGTAGEVRPADFYDVEITATLTPLRRYRPRSSQAATAAMSTKRSPLPFTVSGLLSNGNFSSTSFRGSHREKPNQKCLTTQTLSTP
jgi:hypothetical protein